MLVCKKWWHLKYILLRVYILNYILSYHHFSFFFKSSMTSTVIYWISMSFLIEEWSWPLDASRILFSSSQCIMTLRLDLGSTQRRFNQCIISDIKPWPWYATETLLIIHPWQRPVEAYGVSKSFQGDDNGGAQHVNCYWPRQERR